MSALQAKNLGGGTTQELLEVKGACNEQGKEDEGTKSSPMRGTHAEKVTYVYIYKYIQESRQDSRLDFRNSEHRACVLFTRTIQMGSVFRLRSAQARNSEVRKSSPVFYLLSSIYMLCTSLL